MDKDISLILGLEIRKQRKKTGMSIYELAKKSKISTSSLHQIEKGKANPLLSTLIKLAKVFRIELSDLLADI